MICTEKKKERKKKRKKKKREREKKREKKKERRERDNFKAVRVLGKARQTQTRLEAGWTVTSLR